MPRKTSTAEQLLDAADLLFAEHDYDDVSVRMLCDATGANLASIRYHFGSKEALIVEVIKRGTRELHERRRDRFEAIEQADQDPTPRDLVELIVRSMETLIQERPKQGTAYVRLLGRIYLTRRPVGWELASEEVSLERWDRLLRRALPHLPIEVARARWNITVDSILMAMTDPFATADGEAAVPFDLPRAEYVETLVEYLAAGLGAPYAGAPPPGPSGNGGQPASSA